MMTNSRDLPLIGHNNSSTEATSVVDNDSMQLPEISAWIFIYGIIPINVLGIAGNVIIVWVFSTSRKSSSTIRRASSSSTSSSSSSSCNLTPFFVCLGVADAMFLLLAILPWTLNLAAQPKSVTFLVVNLLLKKFFETLSVNITLAIGVLRWLGISRPQVMLQMTRRHVIRTLAALIGYSVVIPLLYFIQKTVFPQRSYVGKVLTVVWVIAGLVLPTFLLAGFSVALLAALRHQGRQVAKCQRRATVTVLLISGCSLLAYPINIFVILSVVFGSLCDPKTCLRFIYTVMELLIVINASVNFPVYVSLSPSFREEMCQKFQRGQNAELRQFSTDMNLASPRGEATQNPKTIASPSVV